VFARLTSFVMFLGILGWMFCVRWGMRYMKLLRTFTLCWLSLEKFSNGKCDLSSVLKHLSMDFKCGQYVCCIQGHCKLGAACSTLLGLSLACSLTAHRGWIWHNLDRNREKIGPVLKVIWISGKCAILVKYAPLKVMRESLVKLCCH
jgi:hypothetical protein